MKKALLMLGFALTLATANAQTPPDYSKFPLEKEEDFAKANDAVMQAANYLLGTPVTKDPQKRLEGMQFLLMWMQGTPDYSFAIDGTFSLVGDDQQLLGVYLAGMIKYHISNKVKEGGPEASLATLKTLAEYIDNKANGVTPTGDLKKMAEASKKGELEKFAEKYRE